MIRLSNKIELLDTPGILWPKFQDPAAGMRLAVIGSFNDNIIQMTELAMELILFLKKYYPESISRRYDIETPEIMEELVDTVTVLDQIAIKRSCLLKGGEPDLDRAALILLDDFRNVRLGNITLEFSQE